MSTESSPSFTASSGISEAENTESNSSLSVFPRSSSTLTILDGTFFKILYVEQSRTSDASLVTAQCMRCLPKRVEVKGALNSSSNYISHFKRKHDPSVLKEYEAYATEKRAKLLADRSHRRSPGNALRIDATMDWNSQSPLSLISLSSSQQSQEQQQLEDSTKTFNASPVQYSSPLTILDGTFFTILRTEPSHLSDSTLVTAQCMRCLPNYVEVKGSLTSSSNYIAHLKRKHDLSVLREYECYTAEKRGRILAERSIYRPVKTVNKTKEALEQLQQQFEEDVTKFFINAMIPLRTIEDPYFRNIFIHMWQNRATGNKQLPIQLLDQKDLIRHIHLMHEEVITFLKMCFIEYTDHLCTTIDLWTIKNVKLIGVTAHWICCDTLQRKSAVLAFRKFKGSCDAKGTADFLCSLYKEFSLDSSEVVATLSHNVSNFQEDFQHFGFDISQFDDQPEEINDGNISKDETTIMDVREPFTDDIDEEKDKEGQQSDVLMPQHLQCFTYILTLCLTRDGLKTILDDPKMKSIHSIAIKNCMVLWKLASHPRMADVMQTVLGFVLSQPNQTRWNSLYDALRQILGIQSKYVDLCNALNIKSGLNNDCFVYIEEYLSCVAPMAEALNILLDDKNVYFGLLLPCLVALRRKLRSLQTRQWIYCKSLAESLLSAIEKRFSEFFKLSSDFSEHAAIAALSYPRFKDSWLCCYDEECKSKLVSKFRQILASGCVEDEADWDNSNQSSSATQEHESFFDFGKPQASTKTSFQFSLQQELELQHYFSDHNQDVSMLENYPLVKKVFIQYNTPLPSSAPIERLFTSEVIDHASTRLADSVLEMSVFLKGNISYLSTQEQEEQVISTQTTFKALPWILS